MFACVKVRGCRPEQVEDDFAARDFAVFGLEQSIAFSVVDLLAPSSATMAPPRLDPRSTRMVSPQTIWILRTLSSGVRAVTALGAAPVMPVSLIIKTQRVCLLANATRPKCPAAS
jgi:hypothetical protein